MRYFNALLLAAGLVSTAYSRSVQKRAESTAVSTWMSTESPIARAAIFRNIGSDGEFAKDAAAGCVIASPSTSSPD
jgi:glucoamylase